MPEKPYLPPRGIMNYPEGSSLDESAALLSRLHEEGRLFLTGECGTHYFLMDGHVFYVASRSQIQWLGDLDTWSKQELFKARYRIGPFPHFEPEEAQQIIRELCDTGDYPHLVELWNLWNERRRPAAPESRGE